jgi:hypothetical protein
VTEQPKQPQLPAAVVLDPKQVAEMQTSVPQLVAQSQEFKIINDNDDFLASGSCLTALDTRQKKIVDFFELPAKQANDVHKFITTLRGTLLLPLQQATAELKRSRQVYRDKKERERQEKEEAARAAAKAEQEQQAIREAAELESIGEKEAASIVIDRAAIAPPPVVIVHSEIPKEKGISVRKIFKFRTVNPALVKREFLVQDDAKIQAIVSKLGPDAMPIVGGIEVYQEEVETVRGKASSG